MAMRPPVFDGGACSLSTFKRRKDSVMDAAQAWRSVKWVYEGGRQKKRLAEGTVSTSN